MKQKYTGKTLYKHRSACYEEPLIQQFNKIGPRRLKIIVRQTGDNSNRSTTSVDFPTKLWTASIVLYKLGNDGQKYSRTTHAKLRKTLKTLFLSFHSIIFVVHSFVYLYLRWVLETRQTILLEGLLRMQSTYRGAAEVGGLSTSLGCRSLYLCPRTQSSFPRIDNTCGTSL